MRWISVPLCFQNCCKINFAKGPNVNGKLTKWCRKNIPLTILTSMGPMLQELIRFSSSTSSFYFGVFCIVSSGWHNDKGTGVSGYCNASPISTWACKAWKKMLPKRSPVIVTVASFLSDTLVTLNLPVWVAELFIFCLLMGPENLPESLTQSPINWSHAFLPVFITSSQNMTWWWAALPVSILKR